MSNEVKHTYMIDDGESFTAAMVEVCRMVVCLKVAFHASGCSV